MFYFSNNYIKAEQWLKWSNERDECQLIIMLIFYIETIIEWV